MARATGRIRHSFAAGSIKRSGSRLSTRGTPRKIAEGSSPELSPSGDSLAFTRGGQVWIGEFGRQRETHRAHEAARRVVESSLVARRQALAFVSNRERHVRRRLGLRLAHASLHGSEHRRRRRRGVVAGWQFARVHPPAVDSVGPHLRAPARERDPVVDSRRRSQHRHVARSVAREEGYGQRISRDRVGRSAVLVDERRSHCVPVGGGRVDPPLLRQREGGAPTLLTPGAFEVEYVSASPDGRSLVYASNEGDIDRRHVWKVAIDGSSKPVSLTSGKGLEWSPGRRRVMEQRLRCCTRTHGCRRAPLCRRTRIARLAPGGDSGRLSVRRTGRTDSR